MIILFRAAGLAALTLLATTAAHAQAASGEAPEEPKRGTETVANERYYLDYKLRQPADANVDDATLDRYYGLKKTCGTSIPVTYSDAWLKICVAAPLSPAHLINQVYQSLGEPCGSGPVYQKALARIKRVSLAPGGTVGKGLDNQYGYVYAFDKATGTLLIILVTNCFATREYEISGSYGTRVLAQTRGAGQRSRARPL